MLAYFRSDVVTARVDTGTDRCSDISRQRAKPAAHFSHALLNDAFDRSAPTRMEYTHGSLLGIYQNNRQTIGRLDANENARHAGDESVANQRFLRQLGHAVNEIGVDLANGDKWPRLLAIGADMPHERRSVTLDCASGVLFGEAQVESAPAVNT